VEADETLAERTRALMAEGRFAQAQTECIAAFPEASQTRNTLLAEIDRHARERAELTVPQAYHERYYDTGVWQYSAWLGVPIFKSPSDMWSYQEILVDLRPSLVIEFGTNRGGSALYFRSVLDVAGIDADVITVDVVDVLHPTVASRAGIRFINDSSTSPAVQAELTKAIASRPGPIFAILDSDHSAAHVYDEMLVLRDLLSAGDYLVVEDGNVNGHPVLPDWGPGPYEAMERYERDFPGDYRCDTERELKFGFTFAPRGFLIRNPA
jgi:cephalosporin hydroxylase